MYQKLSIYFFSILLLGSSFSCKSTKSGFVKRLAFEITESYVQNWVGGQPGVSGTRVVLNIDKLPEGITPDSLYFQDKVVAIEEKISVDQVLWVGFFIDKTKIRDIQFSNQPEDEYNNKVPLNDYNSFNLSDGEAVLAYSDTKGKYYYRIENLERRPTQSYPSPPPKP